MKKLLLLTTILFITAFSYADNKNSGSYWNVVKVGSKYYLVPSTTTWKIKPSMIDSLGTLAKKDTTWILAKIVSGGTNSSDSLGHKFIDTASISVGKFPYYDGTKWTMHTYSTSGTVGNADSLGSLPAARYVLRSDSAGSPGWFNRAMTTAMLNGKVSIGGSVPTLTTPRAIYGNNFDGSVALTQVIASTYGGTGNGFTKFSGATTSEKTYTLPDASTTILTTNSAVTVAQGGSGRATGTTAYGLIAVGTTATGAQQTLATGNSGQMLSSGGSTALPAWTTAKYPLTAGTLGNILGSNGTDFISIAPDTVGLGVALYNQTKARNDSLVNVRTTVNVKADAAALWTFDTLGLAAMGDSNIMVWDYSNMKAKLKSTKTGGGGGSITYLINYSPTVSNGDIESGITTNWSCGASGSSTVTDETSSPITGAHSLRFTVDGSNSGAHAIQYFAGQLTGKTLHWSMTVVGSVGASIRIGSDGGSTVSYITATASAVTSTGTISAYEDDFFEINRSSMTGQYVIIDNVQMYVTP